MQVDYVPFVDRMIKKYEGGYCWDKKDPGGPTKYGVTCFDLAENRGQKMTSMANWAPIVRAMELPEAEAIYKKKYASAVCFDEMPAGVDCVLMDYAVNSGIGRPPQVLAKLLGQPAQTRIGPSLLAAVKQADPKWLVDAVCAERLHFMHGIRGGSAWAEFGKGWGARVNDLDTYCDHLVAVANNPVTAPPPPVAPDLSTVPTPKATHDDPNVTTNTTVGAGTGAVATGVAVQQAGFPYWAVGVAVGVVIVGGVAYAVWKHGKNTKANNTVILPPGLVPQPGV